MAMSLENRLLSRVNKTESCWLWTGLRFRNGYGQIRQSGGIATTTHRASWIVHVGPIPNGMSVLHRCDNRQCVNPSHLFIGTQDDNMKDMVAKGRQNKNKGEQCWQAKLTKKDIREIRSLYKSGMKQKDIAVRFKISFQHVSDICLRRRWAHVA